MIAELIQAAADLWAAATAPMAPGAAEGLRAVDWLDMAGVGLISFLGVRGMCPPPCTTCDRNPLRDRAKGEREATP